MDSPQKLAFVIQSNRLQGLIWQALLKSQNIAVILEPAKNDLADCINQIAAAGLTLPDILILDAEIDALNPYEFCRWCRDAFPTINIFLTRFYGGPVTDTEQRWATQQGASGFFNGFHRDTLMNRATTNIKHILASLDNPFLNEQALLTVLLNIRRQLGAAPQPTTPILPLSPAAASGLNGQRSQGNRASGRDLKANGSDNGQGRVKQAVQSSTQESPSPDVLNDISWVSSGLRSLNRHQEQVTKSPETLFTAVPPAPPGVKASEIPPSPPTDQPNQVRRYRGVVY